MKSKIFMTISVTFLCLSTLYSQTLLTRSLNGPRNGDKLVKRQIEYMDPGRTGENVIWNFSKQKTINNSYEVYYMEPARKVKDSMFVTGIEHQTMYKYAMVKDSLFMLGFENSGSQLVLTKPELNLVYPFSLGDSITSTYQGSGSYLNMLHSNAEGDLTTVADAIGTLILPGGDTLYNVLRVRSERCYIQRTLPIAFKEDIKRNMNDTLSIDDDTDKMPEENVENKISNIDKDGSSDKIFGQIGVEGLGSSSQKDTIAQDVASNGKSRTITRGQMLAEKTDSIYYRTETCRWYAPGYRYPLFETICNKSHLSKNYTTEINDIATAFYFPPSMHKYLEEDPDNKAIIDSLASKKRAKDITSSDSVSFNYNYYPNPIISDLNVELLLDQKSEVTFRIVDTSGKIVLTSQEGELSAGIHDFTLQTSRLRFGNYVLHILVGKQIAYAMLLKI